MIDPNVVHRAQPQGAAPLTSVVFLVDAVMKVGAVEVFNNFSKPARVDFLFHPENGKILVIVSPEEK